MNFRVNGTAHLTDAPVVKVFGEYKLLEFSVATNQQRKNDTGTYEPYASFTFCKLWVKANSQLDSFLKKGSLVDLTGRSLQERWEKDGVKRERHIIEVDEVRLLDKKPAEGSGDNVTQATPPPSNSAPAKEKQTTKVPEIDIDEDEIPF